MNYLKQFAALCLCLLVVTGCSEKTKQETKEALEATGDAAGAAVEDTKENVKKVGEVLSTAGDKAEEEFSEPPTTPAVDSDDDGVPNSQDANP